MKMGFVSTGVQVQEVVWYAIKFQATRMRSKDSQFLQPTFLAGSEEHICIDCSLLPIWKQACAHFAQPSPVYVCAFVFDYFCVFVALCQCLFYVVGGNVLGVDFVLFRRSCWSYFSLRSLAVQLQVMAAEAREAEQTSQESFEVLTPTLKANQLIFVASLALQVVML